MGRRKRNKEPDPINEAANIPESTSEACVNCIHGETNEMGSIKCPKQEEYGNPEPMGKADRCGLFKIKGSMTEQEAETEEATTPERPGHWTCGDCADFAYEPEATECKKGRPTKADEFVCEDLDFQLTDQRCSNCGNAKFVVVAGDGLADCPITEDYQLSYESCGDWTSEEETERSLSGSDLAFEDSSAHPTTDFNLYRLPHFDSELKYALARVFKYLNEPGSGDPSINIKLKFSEGSVKPTMEIDLPNKIKRSLDATTVIRENGTIRMEMPAQPGFFDDECDVKSEVSESREDPPTDEEINEALQAANTEDGADSVFTISEDQDGLSDEQIQRLRDKAKEAVESATADKAEPEAPEEDKTEAA